MSDPNRYEAEARARKVAKLAAWLLATMRRMPGVTDAEAADAAVRFCDRANEAAWQTAAQESGVNVPSEATRAQLRRYLEVERDTQTPADVFEGLP